MVTRNTGNDSAEFFSNYTANISLQFRKELEGMVADGTGEQEEIVKTRSFCCFFLLK